MKGMTDNEIESRMNEIYHRVYQGGVRVGKYDLFTETEKIELDELYCRQMIISCLVYTPSNFYNERTKEFGYYAQDYIKKLGEERTLELFNEQKERMASAKIYRCAGYDSEGNCYASVDWN